MREIERIVGGDDRRVSGCPAISDNTNAVCVERIRMFAPSREHGDLAHASQMTREEAPDDARPDDADPFHAASRVSQRGYMSVKLCLPRRSRFRRSVISIATIPEAGNLRFPVNPPFRGAGVRRG